MMAFDYSVRCGPTLWHIASQDIAFFVKSESKRRGRPGFCNAKNDFMCKNAKIMGLEQNNNVMDMFKQSIPMDQDNRHLVWWSGNRFYSRTSFWLVDWRGCGGYFVAAVYLA